LLQDAETVGDGRDDPGAVSRGGVTAHWEALDERHHAGGGSRAVRRDADPDEAGENSDGHGHLSLVQLVAAVDGRPHAEVVETLATLLGPSQHELDASRITNSV
jgi:hypothetical protein